MKYICLGYIEPGKFEGMTEDERHAVLDECFERLTGQSFYPETRRTELSFVS
jgi:predicted Fe-S protein YdhL (DUF1289 family)